MKLMKEIKEKKTIPITVPYPKLMTYKHYQLLSKRKAIELTPEDNGSGTDCKSS